MLSDFKLALRQLKRSPGFTVTVLAIFALCLGANVVIFAVVHAVLLMPLPFPNPEQLVATINSYPKAGINQISSSVPNYIERKTVPAFAAVAAFRQANVIIGEAGSPERVPVFRVTPSFFRVLGVSAARGRLFLEDEAGLGRNGVIVLSDTFWRQHFNADPSAIGRTLQIDGVPERIIGILPAKFNYLGVEMRLSQPLDFTDQDRSIIRRHASSVNIIARLKPGFTVAEAQTEINSLNARMAKEDPYAKLVSGAGFRTEVSGLGAAQVAQIRPSLLLLQAGTLFLLLIGVVNLVNLLMIRASVRAKDLAVRRVLGAGWARMAVQPFVETMLLAMVGGGLGLVLAAWGLKLFAALAIPQFPVASNIALDAPVILASLFGSVLVGFLITVPAIAMSHRRDLAPALSVESRSGTTARATHRLRHSLIVAQVALAFVLLTGAGLLGLSFQRVLSTPPGFRPENVLTGEIVLPSVRYGENLKRLAFADRFLDAVRALPGATAVGLSTALPASGTPFVFPVSVEGYHPAPGILPQSHYYYMVAGDYFDALGVPLRAGRYLTSSDSTSKTRVCVVDEAFARYYWPRRSAIGQRIARGAAEEQGPHPYYSVVGVVGAVKQTDLADLHGKKTVYFPFVADDAPLQFTTVVRTVQAPSSAAAGMRRAVARVDPGLPLDNVRTMTDRMDDRLTPRRSTMSLAVLFAGMALALTAVGVYGAIAYAVSQRQREIGVRMALGALPEQILRQFFLLGCRQLLLGTGFGLAGAWFAGHAMSGLLFGVAPFDPGVLAVTAAMLCAVVLSASLIPARRAAQVSPIEALRHD